MLVEYSRNIKRMEDRIREAENRANTTSLQVCILRLGSYQHVSARRLVKQGQYYIITVCILRPGPCQHVSARRLVKQGQ